MREAICEFWPDAATRPRIEDFSDPQRTTALVETWTKANPDRERIASPPEVTLGSSITALFEAVCEKQLFQPTIIHEFPVEVSPLAKQICSKQDILKTAAGYVSDSVCSVGGMSITSHSEIVGDFNSAYSVTSTSHTERGASGPPRDTTTKIEAKWLGACKPDQKPGDIVMPGGFKLNIKDAEKLKGLIPQK